ncbi:MAG: right-handed parallel beta-helix repeat-containing protein [Planctomycetaceae bacterium]|nr:right-handed parallel beta-helix repeat-containing protein [Planctomycetaceae bacterium]
MSDSSPKMHTVLLCGFLSVISLRPTDAGDGRREIADLPIVITAPGRYVVVQDLSYSAESGAAVSIEADHVTIDLNGHVLIGSGKSDTTAIGVRAVDRKQFTISNGTIQGFYFGIDINSPDRVNSRSREHVISGMTLDANTYFGIRLVGADSRIENCHIRSTGGSSLSRHTIPHGVRLVGERNLLKDCCIDDLHLKRFADGRGEIVGVHFDAARGSRMEGNTIIERTTEADDAFSAEEQKERTFAVWINAGPNKDTYLTVTNNRYAGFTVPLAFTPGTDGSVTGNTFSGADDVPIRGKPASQLGQNIINDNLIIEACPPVE